MAGGTIRQDGGGGVERVRADFEATTEGGVLRGEAAFVRYGGLLYRLLGYSTQAGWGTYSGAVTSSISSFRPLTDSAILSVRPWHLDIVTLPGAMSLNTWAGQNAGPVDMDELAQLNRTSPGAVLSAGTRIKRVVGQPLP
jgi:predicted Zn-dependent protease